MKHEETARRIRKALEESGVSQRELSERSGICESSVSHYVNGAHQPGNVSAGRMADVLGVSPLWLMGFDVGMRLERPEAAADRLPSYEEKLSQLNDEGRRMAEECLDFLISTGKYKKEAEIPGRAG